MTIHRVIALCAIALLAACDDSVAPVQRAEANPALIRSVLGALSVAPIDSAGATLAVRDMNDSGVVVGNVATAQTPTTFRWSAGAFTTLPFTSTQLGINDRGDVVGMVGDVPMALYRDSAGPSRLFRPDTNASLIFPVDLNNQLEILLRIASGGEGVGVIKCGQFSQVSVPGTCSRPVGINQQGRIVMQTRCELYNFWYVRRSPYQTAPETRSDRFAGESCGGGRFSEAFAVNDSGEVLESREFQTGKLASVDAWTGATGCRNLSSEFPGLTLRAFNSLGLLGGREITPSDTHAVVALGGSWARVDDLIEPASTWHIVDIIQVKDSRLMLALGHRIADRRRIAVTLAPK